VAARKSAAILKEALAPHFTSSVLNNYDDESNDKIDKSCIILVRFLDPQVGNVVTHFYICLLLILKQQKIFLMLLKSV